MKNLLKSIRSTLDAVEVKGRSNLDAMLGCMNALDTVISALEAAERPKAPEPPEAPEAPEIQTEEVAADG